MSTSFPRGTNSRRIGRPQGRVEAESLTLAQTMALECYIEGIVDAFDSIAAARAAWRTHRRRLMARCEPDERPAAFWLFEQGDTRLMADDPDEPIRPSEWGVTASARPAFEAPARTPAQIRASLEAHAREVRLRRRRTEYLAGL